MSTEHESPLVDDLLKQAQEFCDREGITLPTLGRRVLNDTAFFSRIEKGGGFTARTYERFQRYFADNGGEAAARREAPSGRAA